MFLPDHNRDAKTTGPCSFAVSGNNNRFEIKCVGISEEQGEQFLEILNKIANDQLDPKIVMGKLDEIEKGVVDLLQQKVDQLQNQLNDKEKRKTYREWISKSLEAGTKIKQACTANKEEKPELEKIAIDWANTTQELLKKIDISYVVRFNAAQVPTYSFTGIPKKHENIWNYANARNAVLSEILKELAD